MATRFLRRTLPGALASLAALLAGPSAPARAVVEASRILTPTDPAYGLFDEALPAQRAFTVTGTTSGSGSVALRCYYGIGPNEYWTVVKEVLPSAGAFAVEVSAEALYRGPCVLRAVPPGDIEAHPPGDTAEEAADPFHGPRVAGSSFETLVEGAAPYDYELEASTLSAYLDFDSVGDCGLSYAALFAPQTLRRSAYLFECDAALFEEDRPPSGPATRSQLQVDGRDAYGPATATYLARRLLGELKAKGEPAVAPLGVPRLTVSESFDASDGALTIHELDPIVRCAPSSAFPPTAEGCREFVATGVQLERTWQTSAGGRVAQLSDRWSSIDGAPHALDALYDETAVDDEHAGGAYELPGSGAFAPAAPGETVTLPAGPHALYYKSDAATPPAGDGKAPQGAILYATAPSAPLAFYSGTAAEERFNGFELPYRLALSAGGAQTLQLAFVQAYALGEVQELAAAVLAGYPPAPPATTEAPAGLGPALGGPPVAGNPQPRGGAHLVLLGRVRGTGGRARFTIACVGPAGSSCAVRAALSAREHLRHGRPVALSARRHRGAQRVRTVALGTRRATLAAGRRLTLTVRPNALGRRLLARFGTLPARLEIFQAAGTRRTRPVVSRALTIRPARGTRHHARRSAS